MDITLRLMCNYLSPFSPIICLNPWRIPLGFPAGWLLQAFSMACFFWTSVREKPEKRKINSIIMKLSK